MGYTQAAKTDVDSIVPEEWGGMWFLREALGSSTLGLTVLELEPGGKNMEHDETDSGQEEVYYVVEGEIAVEFEDERVRLDAEDAVRVDPAERRQLHNIGDSRATLVIVGAPQA